MFKKEPKIGDYVVAEWLDSCTDSNWKEFDGVFPEWRVETIGILVHQDKDKIVVAHMKDNRGKYKYSTLITTGMLTKLTKLT